MAWILRDGDELRVARDVVDGLKSYHGEEGIVSHGRVETSDGSCRTWLSTMPIAETERLLRHAARKEGLRVTFLLSQAR